MPNALTREFVRFVEVKPASGTAEKAVHALIVGAVTLGALSLLFGIAVALLGFTGVFVAIMAYNRSQRTRIRVLSQLAVAYTVIVALGACTTYLPSWLGVIAMSALATVTAFGYHALLSDPPGPMLLIMGACVAGYVPTLGVPISTLVLVTALSMVIGCTTSVLLQQPRRRAAVQQQLDALAQAVDALEAGLRQPTEEVELGRLRDAAFGALFQAQASLVSSYRRGRTPTPRAQQIENELHTLHARLLQLVARTEMPWATVDVASLDDHYLGSPNEGYLLRWAFSSASPAWLAARRTGLALLIAGLFATMLQLSHPYWAEMTAALVLNTTADRITSARRAGHRVVGTAVGVGLFYLLHKLHLPPVVILALVIGLAALTQILAPRQYALATMVITPMPLFMATMHAGSPPVDALIGSRVLETVIGALAAMVVLWVQGPAKAIILVRRQFRRALVAAEEVLHRTDLDPRDAATLTARRNLHFEQLAAAKALAMVLPEQPEALKDWPDVEAALGELTYTILTAARTTDPASALRWRVMAETLQSFLESLPPVSTTAINAGVAAQVLHEVLADGRPLAGGPA